jgi:ubiquinone/menaquinone biosynthesis C-methylase UbiE
MEILKTIKAMADETRLRLLAILDTGELNVNEIVRITEMGQSRISRHLGILTDSGLLTSRRDGSWVYYHAVDTPETPSIRRDVLKQIADESIVRRDLERVTALRSERSRRVREFFDSVADDWSDLKREIFNGIDQAGSVLEYLTHRNRLSNIQGPLVDIGCGTGDLYTAARETDFFDVVGNGGDTGILYIGVDNSPNMLTRARTRFSDETRLEFRLGEIEHLPLLQHEAGIGVMNMVLHHLQTPSKGIGEVFRILKPGGRILIADFEKHEQESMREQFGDRRLGFEPEEIIEWLQGAGFVEIESERKPLRRGPAMIIYMAERPPNNFYGGRKNG